MAKISKPDISIQWAQAGSIVVPSDVKKQSGWVVEKPANEYMNWIQNRQDSGIAYAYQMGISEWDSTTEYQYASGYASYVQYNGTLYKAIQTGTNKVPNVETGYWAVAFDSYGAASTVNASLTSHITNYGTLAALSNVTTARSNLSVYSIAQCDAAFAPIAGNSAQTFLVGSASSANHAVRKSQFDAKTGQATETTAGISEIATQAEVNAGADDLAYVTSLKLGTHIATRAASGAETTTGSSTTKFVTPAALKSAFTATIGGSEVSVPLPGGLILKAGIYNKGSDFTSNEQTSISFASAFPTGCLNVQVTLYNVNNEADCEMVVSWKSATTAGFTLCVDNVVSGSKGRAVSWFAIGY